jgi:hypothetical protein
LESRTATSEGEKATSTQLSWFVKLLLRQFSLPSIAIALLGIEVVHACQGGKQRRRLFLIERDPL